jgi:hypothetical protein
VIVFNGEKGFTKARASRVNGTVFESAKQVCKRQKEGGSESSFHFTLLSASTPRGKGALSFNATKFTSPNSIPDAGLTSFSVSLFQQKGSMSVLHSISQSSEEDSFAVSGPAKRPTMASVTPPAPFSGSASFQRELGSSASWTGTLATELPGIGPVSLAGPEFSASLCVDHFCPDSGGSSRQAVLIVAAAAGRRAAKAAAPSPTPWPR